MRRLDRERGTALLTSLLVLVLMVGITAGLTALVITDTQVRSLDGTRSPGLLRRRTPGSSSSPPISATCSRPTSRRRRAALNAIAATPPALGVTVDRADGTDGYTITFPVGAAGNPLAAVTTVNSGPFQGLVGLATPYQMTRHGAAAGSHRKRSLTRTLQTVAIPVFQFGIFSENDLSFFAGPELQLRRPRPQQPEPVPGGRQRHTLTLSDRVTAVGEIIRTNLSNGWDTNTNYNGPVRVITAPAAFRPLAKTEGSLVGGVGIGVERADVDEPVDRHLQPQHHERPHGRAAARPADHGLRCVARSTSSGARSPGENVTTRRCSAERFFTLASLRILLSDTAADITGLPGVTATAPIALGIGEPAATCGSAAVRRGAGAAPRRAGSHAGRHAAPRRVHQDREAERRRRLGRRDARDPEPRASPAGSGRIPRTGCPTAPSHGPNAILRIQRLRDRTPGAGGCCDTVAEQADCARATSAERALRPARRRAAATASPTPNRCASAASCTTSSSTRATSRAGSTARWREWRRPSLNVNGFTVYFSDRRGNRNGAGNETGEFGFEDIVNPASGTGAPNNALDTGEDFNGNGTHRPTARRRGCRPGRCFRSTSTARPWTTLDPGAAIVESDEIRHRPPQSGDLLPPCAEADQRRARQPRRARARRSSSENPIYLQGNWNANNGGFGNPHVATAIIADAVTLLSNDWNDRNSLRQPAQSRNRATPRRRGIASRSSPARGCRSRSRRDATRTSAPTAAPTTSCGTRELERRTLNFRGSIVSFFHSRQATGTYKCCTDVYSPPTRGYNFDVEFLTPTLLPPRTPMFRDVNTTGFAQIIRPR